MGTRLVFVDGDADDGMDLNVSGSGEKEHAQSQDDTAEVDTDPRTDPPNKKPRIADTTEFFLLTTMAVSALFLLLRHIPHSILGVLLLLLGLGDFLRDTSFPFNPVRLFTTSTTPPSASLSPSPTQHPTIILTGLRNPCAKIDDFAPGLLAKSYLRDGDGKIVGARVGVIGVVEVGGVVRAGMRIVVKEPRVRVEMERI